MQNCNPEEKVMKTMLKNKEVPKYTLEEKTAVKQIMTALNTQMNIRGGQNVMFSTF